jgi:pyruvate,water dikinase
MAKRVQKQLARSQRVVISWVYWCCIPGALIKEKYKAFQLLLQLDKEALELIAQLEEIKQGRQTGHLDQVNSLISQLTQKTKAEISALERLTCRSQSRLFRLQSHIESDLMACIQKEFPSPGQPYTHSLKHPGLESLIGGKAYTLTHLPESCRVLVPKGFVITTKAFAVFVNHNDLRPTLDSLLAQIEKNDRQGIAQVSHHLQGLVTQAELPKDMCQEVQSSLSQYVHPNSSLAFRSSAVGEDLTFSFAGQYSSVLHVTMQDWQEAYKQVIASKYSPQALYYRLHHGLSDHSTPMAVLVMEMVQPLVSGVLYTRIGADKDSMDLYVVQGIGETLVQGQRFDSRIICVPESKNVTYVQGPWLLSEDTLWTITSTGRHLDDFFKRPQEIEWSITASQDFFLLQSRPLHIAQPLEPQTTLKDLKPLFQGQWVSSGSAVGRTYRLNDPHDLASVPEKVILVVSSLSPNLSMVLDRVVGIVAEYGTPACHLASLAREAGLPVLCQVKGILNMRNDQLISLDADAGNVYEGRVFQDTAQNQTQGWIGKDPLVQDILEQMLPLIAPLSHQSRGDNAGTLDSVHTLHDLVRYVHEAGVQSMFTLVGKRGLNKYAVKRLDADIPLVMFVLDVQEGLIQGARGKKVVTPKDMTSRPMCAFWRGLSHPCVSWDPGILHYDWDAYGKSSVVFTNVEKSTLFSSYAVLARTYFHALIKFGYHFVVVDGLIGASAEANYLRMRFKGGGGLEEQRILRLQLLKGLLHRFGFQTKLTGDFIDAFFDRHEAKSTETRTAILGMILGKTVLLDFHLKNSEDVHSSINTLTNEIMTCFHSFEKKETPLPNQSTH